MAGTSQTTPSGPNPLVAGWSVIRARFVPRPRPTGSGRVEHGALGPVLRELAGPNGLDRIDVGMLAAYLAPMADVDPDGLTPGEALAFWLNLYNAQAIALAARARSSGAISVLRLPGAFDRRDVEVAGERLSLNDIEHGKIRRFGDPRIHGALVCGSLSCPTLRNTPFVGEGIDADLDEQMRRFLSSGGAWVDTDRGVLSLSRVFLWYGADFVRPHRMPTMLPARRRDVARAAASWLDAESAEWVLRTDPNVEFQGYDWSLGCAVG
jgi:hypothetical protein